MTSYALAEIFKGSHLDTIRREETVQAFQPGWLPWLRFPTHVCRAQMWVGPRLDHQGSWGRRQLWFTRFWWHYHWPRDCHKSHHCCPYSPTLARPQSQHWAENSVSRASGSIPDGPWPRASEHVLSEQLRHSCELSGFVFLRVLKLLQ